MFELNVVGWSALLGVGSLPSLLLWALGVPRFTALALGEGGTFAVVKARDHLRWRAAPIQMQVDGSPEAVRSAVVQMREAGLPVEYVELPSDVGYDGFGLRPAVRCRQLDREKVRTELAQRGL